MEKPEIIARASKLSIVILIAISTFILPVFRTHLEMKPLNWEMFNPTRTNGIIFFLFMMNDIFWILKYFDREPQLTINSSGITKRKYYWPFINTSQMIPWDAVESFYFITNGKLILQPKETLNEIKIWLTDLDIQAGDILTVIRKYAELNNIADLGVEKSNHAS